MVTGATNFAQLATAGDIVFRSESNRVILASVLGNTAVAGGLCIYSTNVGVNVNLPVYHLDVNGISRSAIPISSISNSNATFGNNSYGIYYYITNSGFSNIIFTAVTPTPAAGWYILLRNNTGSYLSITPTGASAGLLASAFTIPPSNSITIAYDSTASTWVAF